MFSIKTLSAARLRALRRSSPVHKVVAIGSSVIVLLLLVTTILLVRRYQAELADAERELKTLDVLLAKDTERSLQSVSLLLDGIAEQLPYRGEDDAAPVKGNDGSRETYEYLKARAAGLPQLDAISIVGADGRLVNFSRSWPVPTVQLADRDYFKRLRDHPSSIPYLTEPVANRGTGTPTVYVAKRLEGPDGQFAGLLLGAIELGYFQRYYALLHLEPGNSVVLRRDDGTILACYPPRNAAQVSPAFVPATGASSSTLPSRDDGRSGTPQMLVSTPVEGFGLHVDVGRATSAVLSDWRREALVTSGFTLIAVLCIILLIWALVRRFRAYEAVATAAIERERAILARQEVEEALRQSQKMEAVGQLTGGVAHDFNNLLTVIGSSVELLRRHDLDPDRRARYVEAIADASGRAAQLTRQLLAFSRRQALKPETFDVSANIRSIGQMIDRLTGTRITVVLNLPQDPCYIHADPSQFDTAIVNLAVNARDAMPDGGCLTIAVTRTGGPSGQPAALAPPEAFAAITVSDTGTGIARELRERVFEPFFTTKAIGQGTGLGLSQVIGFARQSGGDVSLSSEPGLGAAFTIHLPCVSVATPSVQIPVDRAAIVHGRGARILVVDDDGQVAALTAQLLRELKYFAVVVNSAEDALDLLVEDSGFAAVVSDVVMAGMDGLTLGRTLGDLHPDLPVLLCTGFSATLARGGANEFALLHKPFSIKDLGQALHAILRDRDDAGPQIVAAVPGIAVSETTAAEG